MSAAGALGDGQGHSTRSLAFSDDGATLFIAVGSRGNAALEAAPRATVQALDLGDGSMRTVAAGLRNPVGIVVHPETAEIYVVVNERAKTSGVNGIGIFLGDNDIRTATLADHVAYLADLVGPEHVGISLDYAAGEAELGSLLGSKPEIWPAGQGYDTPNLQFAAPEQLPELAETLLGRGWDEDDVRAVLGGTFRRVAAEVWK